MATAAGKKKRVISSGKSKDTLKKAENATVGMAKSLIFYDLKSAPPNFSVFP